jgi:hypothetical protein
MATTWVTFRDTLVRPLLKDAGALVDSEVSPKWTDEELMAYANMALDDISGSCPEPCYVVVTGTNGTLVEFSLPDDLLSLDAVQWDTQVLQEYEAEPGRVIPGTTKPPMYMVDWPSEGSITFTRAPSATQVVTLFYSAYRQHIVGDNSTLPVGRHRWMEQAIALYIGFLAHLREGVGTANLEQWKSRQDLNVGNPLNVEAREFLLQYQRLVRENRPRELRTYAV